MKIYTKAGDQGQTSLWGGERVAKDNPRLLAYGTLDEANSALGLALSQAFSGVFTGAGGVGASAADLAEEPGLLVLCQRLRLVQQELFHLGAELATPRGHSAPKSSLVDQNQIKRLESEIDEMESSLEPLKNFILPGGTSMAASLHLARTIVRRAEREIASLHRAEILRQEVLQYVNRLSDFLFVAARYANHTAGVPDISWQR